MNHTPIPSVPPPTWAPQRTGAWFLVLAVLMALVMGLTVSVISPVVGIGLGVAVAGATILVRRPDWAWVLTLLLVSQAIPGTVVPDLPLGFARVKLYELTFLAGLFGSVLAVHSHTPAPFLQAISRHRWTGALLLVVILASAVYSRFFLGNRELVLGEARPYLALLALGIVSAMAPHGQASRTVDRALVVAGALLSAIVMVQLLTGLRILDSRVEDLGLSSNTGITRSVTDTGTIVQAYAIFRLAQLSARSGSVRLWAMPGLLICIIGLLGTFTRGAWVATAAGALVAAYVAGGLRRVTHVAALGGIALVVALMGLFVARPEIAQAMVDRALSVTQEMEQGASYGWRRMENRQAWESIQRRPLLGVALGGAYKNEVKLDAGFLNDQYFIHNGYLYFPLKMGIPGVLLGLWLLLKLVGLITRHTAGDPIHVAQAGACVVILLTNVSGPVLSKFLPLLVLMTFVSVRETERLAESK